MPDLAPEARLATVLVSTPVIEGHWSVGLPERELTAEEVGDAVNRVLDYYDDALLADAMMRWQIGRIFHHAQRGVTWRDVLAHVNRAIGEDWGKTLLYECRAFFATYPDSQRAERKVREMIETGYYSWTRFRGEHGIGRRADRDALADGDDPREHAAKEIERGTKEIQRGTERMENAVKDLHEDDPLRIEAAEIQALAHQDALASAHLLAQGATEAAERGPWRSEAHLAYVRRFVCPWTGAHDVEAHHIYQDAKGEKCSDAFTVPLGVDAHRELHTIGQASFEAKYGITMEAVCLSVLGFQKGAQNGGPVHLTLKREYAD